MISILHQNLNWCFATYRYSGFENLYFRVEMNFGFISTAKVLISSMQSFKSDSLYPENFSISLFQQFIFFSYFDERISEDAASCDGLNRRSDASSSEISWRY